MSWAVVIPTNRPEEFNKFFDAWKDLFKKHSIKLYIIEDNEKHYDDINLDGQGVDYDKFCWEDIDKDLGDKAWIIPRKCDSIRSYGFLKAYQDKHDYICTLDDDVRPIKEPGLVDYFQGMGMGFCKEKAPSYFSVGDMTDGEIEMRGFPFKERLEKEVWIQYGGWTNVLDFGASDQLSLTKTDGYEFKKDFKTVPKYLGLTGCIMNAAWKREATPIMYQLLMGKGYPYSRWGDIWSGLLAKRVSDLHDKAIAINGYASVEHIRASNVFSNIVQEASGYEPNEYMWDNILRYSENYVLPTQTYRSAVRAMSESLNFSYHNKLMKAVSVWTRLFEDG